ncbi:MAG: hypothetical protein LBG69_06025 [Zoogloeaceae bacterium]|jgi:hypothetical protein|nr:hypothetical protein [Zoogloeaceae bacterium]
MIAAHHISSANQHFPLLTNAVIEGLRGTGKAGGLPSAAAQWTDREAYALKRGVSPDRQSKRGYDLFHCVCAELDALELLSGDAHIQKIQQLIAESSQHAQT